MLTVALPGYGQVADAGGTQVQPVGLNGFARAEGSPLAPAPDSVRWAYECIPDDNLCPRGCSPVNDDDCEILRRVELLERFIKTHEKGNLYTPDPREDLLVPKSEVYRLLHGSQALGYLELYASTGKEPCLREVTERLEALLNADSLWTDTAWDGDLALAFLYAHELTGRPDFFEAGIERAGRLAQRCGQGIGRGKCELNWGLSAALCLVEAHRLTGESRFLEAARWAVARTQGFQNEDGSLPHQASYGERNLLYSSWVAFQLLRYSMSDPGIADVSDMWVFVPGGGRLTLDFTTMTTRLVSLLERQLTVEGLSWYAGDMSLVFPDLELCQYCSSPMFERCREFCGRVCDPVPDSYPCACVQDLLHDCPGMPERGWPDPLCEYCSNPMYALCEATCDTICGADDDNFPCRCVSDPKAQCPIGDSVWVATTYYDELDPGYDTRGWTSELASTAFALARAGKHEAKRKILDFLFSLQNKDGSFPDKWGYKTEEPGSRLWLWASAEHSVIRSSIIFRVLASLLVPEPAGAGADQQTSHRDPSLKFAPRIVEMTSAFPNPSSAGVGLRFTLPQGTAGVELVVVDIAGRTVKSFGRLPSDGSDSRVNWDGTDVDGRRVAPGVYFAQVIGEGWRSAKKLVILGR